MEATLSYSQKEQGVEETTILSRKSWFDLLLLNYNPVAKKKVFWHIAS